MSLWAAIILGGVLTYAMRLSFIYLFAHVGVPERLRSALRFVAPAVLSAIILPELLMPAGAIDVSWQNVRLLAGAAAIVLAWRTKSTLITLIGGMLVLWALAYVL